MRKTMLVMAVLLIAGISSFAGYIQKPLKISGYLLQSTDPQNRPDLFAMSDNGQKAYFKPGLSNSVFSSSDNGANFTMEYVTNWRSSNIACSSDASIIYLSYIWGGTQISKDNGQTWNKILQPVYVNIISTDSTGNMLVFSNYTYSTCYVSNDYGATVAFSNNLSFQISDISMSSDGTIILCVGGGGASISLDSGKTFSAVSGVSGLKCAVSADGAKLVVLNGTTLWASSNSGTDWSSYTLDASYSNLIMSKDASEIFILGTATEISSDLGKTFSSYDYAPLGISSDGTVIYGVKDGVQYFSVNSGTTWQKAGYTDNNSYVSSIVGISVDVKRIGILGNDGTYMLYSKDGGQNFTTIQPATNETFTAATVSPDGSNLFLLVYNGTSKIYTAKVSSNNGATWQTYSLPAGTPSFPIQTSYDGKTIACGFGSNLLLSTSTGSTWNEIATPLKPEMIQISSDGGTIAIGDSSTSYYYSQDNGVKWNEITLPPDCGGTLVMASDGITFYLNDMGNLMATLSTTNYGQNWNILCFTNGGGYGVDHLSYDNLIKSLSMGEGTILVTSDFSNFDIIPDVRGNSFSKTGVESDSAINYDGTIIVTGSNTGFYYINRKAESIITTDSVFSISTQGANVTGTVAYEGASSVTERGICYGTNPNPTVDDSKVASGTGAGTFTADLTGFTQGQLYFVRAYAVNSYGTFYGNELNFPTATANVVTFSANTGGTVTGNLKQILPDGGICLPVEAKANTGFNFMNWTSGETVISTDNPLTLSGVYKDLDVTANFVTIPPTASLTVASSPVAGGTTSPSGQQTINTNSPVEIIATANTGWHFKIWDVQGFAVIGSKNLSDTTIAITGDTTVTAMFEQDTQTAQLTVQVKPDNSGTTTPTGTSQVSTGNAIQITATANAGWQFDKWTSDSGDAIFANAIESNTSVTLSGNVIITANFQQTPSNDYVTLGKIYKLDPGAISNPLANFAKKPTLYGLYNGKKVQLKVKNNIKGSTSFADCEWTSKIPLLSKSIWKNQTQTTEEILSKQAVTPLEMALLITATDSTGKSLKNAETGLSVSLYYPTITGLYDGSGNPVVSAGVNDRITIKGTFFGITRPSVCLEFEKNGKIKALKLKTDKSLTYPDYNGKVGKSCMDINTGESQLTIIMPSKWPTGWDMTAKHNIVIDNGILRATKEFFTK